MEVVHLRLRLQIHMFQSSSFEETRPHFYAKIIRWGIEEEGKGNGIGSKD